MMLALGNDNHKNALDRLMLMEANESKTVLPKLTETSSSDFSSPKSRSYLLSWVNCKQDFCIVLLFFLLEVLFIFFGVCYLNEIREPALTMIVLASIAIIVIWIEWWNRWVWREASPMQIIPNLYKSRVNESARLFERQQAMLKPPGKPESGIEVTPVIHVASPYGEPFKELYPNGGGFKGRVAEMRRYDRPFMCNYVLLTIIYVLSFFCLLATMIWISCSIHSLSHDSTQVRALNSSVLTTISPSTTTHISSTDTTDKSGIKTTDESGIKTTDESGIKTTDEQNTIEAEDMRNKKINALKLILVFVLIHFLLLIIRCLVIFYNNRVVLCSHIHDEHQEEDNGQVPIVVHLQNNPPLEELNSRYK